MTIMTTKEFNEKRIKDSLRPCVNCKYYDDGGWSDCCSFYLDFNKRTETINDVCVLEARDLCKGEHYKPKLNFVQRLIKLFK